MPDPEKIVPRERFDRAVTWPEPARDLDREPVHPERIPDTPRGPYDQDAQ
jgi:hypothetical protein